MALAVVGSSEAHASALGAARATKSKNAGPTKSYLMKASTTIYAGGLVMVDSDGVALPAAASASNHGVVGVATVTKTSASSGTYLITVQEGWFLFGGATLEQADVGVLVYAEDDQTIDETAGANEPLAGMLVEYVGASSGWVHVSTIYQNRTAISTDATTMTGDLSLAGGAGAATFTDSASSIVVPDNDTTALVIGSTGLLDLVRIDTGDNTETLVVKGTTTTDALHVDVGDVQMDEDLAVTGALTLGGAAAVTGVLSGAGTAAWGSVVAGANTACNTTCTAPCLFGFDSGAADAELVVACTDATADICICFGAN